MDATWPAAAYHRCGPFTLREGQGGGSRVCAATLDDPAYKASAEDIAAAETRMREMGQQPLYMIREGDAQLDTQLASLGYGVSDPVDLLACEPALLADRTLPRVTVFTLWEPLAIMREIWASAGIGPERQAVMARVTGPKTGLLGRHRDKPAGAGFVAVDQGMAMVHSVEILPHRRRQGMGGWMIRGAAHWALSQGADSLAVLVRRQNRAAREFCASLGMSVVGQYHYRQPQPRDEHQ
nr:GNAT family N-acetyltransferase [Pontibaca salina]